MLIWQWLPLISAATLSEIGPYKMWGQTCPPLLKEILEETQRGQYCGSCREGVERWRKREGPLQYILPPPGVKAAWQCSCCRHLPVRRAAVVFVNDSSWKTITRARVCSISTVVFQRPAQHWRQGGGVLDMCLGALPGWDCRVFYLFDRYLLTQNNVPSLCGANQLCNWNKVRGHKVSPGRNLS